MNIQPSTPDRSKLRMHKVVFPVAALVVFIVGSILAHSRRGLSWEDNERILASIRNDDIQTLEKLAYHLDEFDEFEKFGETPIHEAAGYGRIRSLEYLLSKGVNVNARDRRQQTPLHVAIRNVNTHRSSGRGMLGSPPETERMAVIQLLLDRGADLHAVDKDGKSPRDWAISLHLAGVTAILDSERLNQ